MKTRSLITLAMCGLFVTAGCSQDGNYSDYGDAPLSDNTDSGHSHVAVHGGQLLEFDPSHGHHAELVFNSDSREIILYFYGAQIGEAHPAEDLIFELEADGDEMQLNATASPMDGETEDSCSRFVIAGSELPEHITSAEMLDGHFHVLLDGGEFSGHFGHDEDHHHGDDHEDDHEHDDHEHDEHDEHDDK